MPLKNPTTLLVTLQVLQGLGKSKNHMHQAVHEVFQAVQSLAATVSTIAKDLNFGQNYPILGQTFERGERLLSDLVERTRPEPNLSPRSVPEKEARGEERTIPFKKSKRGVKTS